MMLSRATSRIKQDKQQMKKPIEIGERQNNDARFKNDNWYKVFFILSFLLLALLFMLHPEIDIWTSSLFYNQQDGFYLAHNPIIRAIHKGVPIACGITAIVCGFIGLKILLKHRSLHPRYYRKLIYFALVCLLGAGFIVHNVVKDSFNRARPKEIVEFGGESKFTPAFVISDQCHSNCSFVSGHAAAGFMFFALSFIFAGRNKRFSLNIFALFLGLGIGLLRIIQGGHFLSDIIFAGYIMYAVAYVLAKLMRL